MQPMDLQQLTHKLATAAADGGMTREQLGSLAGLSRTATGAILAGGDFKVSSLVSLAEALGFAVVLMPVAAEASAPTTLATAGALPPRQHALTVAEASRQRAEQARQRLAQRGRP